MDEPAFDIGYSKLLAGRVGVRRFSFPPTLTHHQIVAFPFAGGQTLAFKMLAKALSAKAGLLAIEAPGHGLASGPPVSNLLELVNLYLAVIPLDFFSKSILLGHSFGGLLAFELACALERAGTPAKGLVISSTRPPHRKIDYPKYSTWDDKQLTTVLTKLGAFPADWSFNPKAFESFRESIRADFLAFETYEPTGRLTKTNVLALRADADEICLPEHVQEWDRYCTDFAIADINSGHLHVVTHPELASERIATFLDTLGGR